MVKHKAGQPQLLSRCSPARLILKRQHIDLENHNDKHAGAQAHIGALAATCALIHTHARARTHSRARTHTARHTHECASTQSQARAHTRTRARTHTHTHNTASAIRLALLQRSVHQDHAGPLPPAARHLRGRAPSGPGRRAARAGAPPGRAPTGRCKCGPSPDAACCFRRLSIAPPGPRWSESALSRLGALWLCRTRTGGRTPTACSPTGPCGSGWPPAPGSTPTC